MCHPILFEPWELIALSGVAPPHHISFPRRCRESTGLRLPGRHSSAKTLSKTRYRGYWRWSYCSKRTRSTNLIHFSISVQHLPTERAPVPLAIHHSPFCFTFAFFPDASTPPVLDPSQLEQRLSAGLVSIALNAQKEICVLQKLGGVPLGADDIVRLVEIVVVKAREMHNLVETRLQQDWAGRNIEIR